MTDEHRDRVKSELAEREPQLRGKRRGRSA
jgi:hypothetical protein